MGEDIATVFLPEEMKEVLRTCTEVSFDGTFFCCPIQYSQIFTLFAVVQEKTFPCVTILMTAKNQALYEAVFRKILEAVPAMQPEIAISDFEQASRNAIKAVFPNIRVSGCSFHFMQATLRMARKQGLANAFQSNDIFRTLLKRIMHLNFLPAHQISPALEVLAREESGLTDNEERAWKKVKKYLRTYWIDRIGPDVMTVFGLNRKTNNGAEQYHGRLKARILSHRPRIWKFLEVYNIMAQDCSADIHRHQAGIPIARKRRTVNLANSQRRAEAEEKLTSGKIKDR